MIEQSSRPSRLSLLRMLPLFALVALAGLAGSTVTAAAQQNERGVAPEEQILDGDVNEPQQIVYGTDADEGEYPFMVSMAVTQYRVRAPGTQDWSVWLPATNPGAHNCAATLVAPDKLLSAAHCVWRNRTFDPAGSDAAGNDHGLGEWETQVEFEAMVGRTTLSNVAIGQVIQIIDYSVPADWDPAGELGASWGSDVAVLTLAAPVTSISPVPLIGISLPNLDELNIVPTLIGWGCMDVGTDCNTPANPNADTLQEGIGTAVVPCTVITAQFADTDLCMWQPDHNASQQPAFCRGDSGGPYLMDSPFHRPARHAQFAIHSFGTCAASDGVAYIVNGMTSVYNARDFIRCSAQAAVFTLGSTREPHPYPSQLPAGACGVVFGSASAPALPLDIKTGFSRSGPAAKVSN